MGGIHVEWLKTIVLVFSGLSMGGLIAAGLFAFVTMIGVVTRLAGGTKTAKYLFLYEDFIILGAAFGNLISLFSISILVGQTGLIFFGLFAGVYVGCLSVALAEAVNVIPVLTKRIHLKFGMPFLLLSLAVGKCLGSFYQLFWKW